MSLIMSVADTRDPRSLASKLRRKRFELFEGLLSRVPRPISILDVGGTTAFWRGCDILADPGVEMTILNVSFASDDLPAPKQIFGDARSLDFPDKSFDVVYSNSVIEHVGNSLDQREMANHIRRVGKRYFVQTPNYYFPIEPHFLFPGFQFLPTSARAHLLNRFDLGWMAREPTLDVARDVVDSVRLLKRSEFARLFPDSHVYDEMFCGLTKSFIAYDGF